MKKMLFGIAVFLLIGLAFARDDSTAGAKNTNSKSLQKVSVEQKLKNEIISQKEDFQKQIDDLKRVVSSKQREIDDLHKQREKNKEKNAELKEKYKKTKNEIYNEMNVVTERIRIAAPWVSLFFSVLIFVFAAFSIADRRAFNKAVKNVRDLFLKKLISGESEEYILTLVKDCGDDKAVYPGYREAMAAFDMIEKKRNFSEEYEENYKKINNEIEDRFNMWNKSKDESAFFDICNGFYKYGNELFGVCNKYFQTSKKYRDVDGDFGCTNQLENAAEGFLDFSKRIYVLKTDDKRIKKQLARICKIYEEKSKKLKKISKA